MRYNSSEKRGLLNKISRQQDNYMELANTFQVVNYHINNTICCFDCREFCRAEHKIYDWLTRQEHSSEHTVHLPYKKNYKNLSNYTHYSHYHRHRRRSKLIVQFESTYSREPNSKFTRQTQNCRHNKFFYIKSKKTKFKRVQWLLESQF